MYAIDWQKRRRIKINSSCIANGQNNGELRLGAIRGSAPSVASLGACVGAIVMAAL
jgi:hypothetical protein